MQISYDLFQAQHRRKVHTHYLVFQVAFPFILLRQWFPQVGSEMRSRSMAVCFATRFVLWECLTSFPDISAFLGSELQRLRRTSGLLLAQDWFLAGALSAGPCSHWGATSHFSSFSGFYSKVIKFVGTCCLLLWQAALKCLNHSIAFILLPA